MTVIINESACKTYLEWTDQLLLRPQKLKRIIRLNRSLEAVEAFSIKIIKDRPEIYLPNNYKKRMWKYQKPISTINKLKIATEIACLAPCFLADLTRWVKIMNLAWNICKILTKLCNSAWTTWTLWCLAIRCVCLFLI